MAIPQLANLQIEKLIVHQVFQRNEEREMLDPKLSNDYTNLSTVGLSTLQERITDALGSDSYSIEMSINDDAVGSTFDLCNQILVSSDKVFKDASKEIAFNLARAQKTRKIPGGILVVFTGTIGFDNSKYVGVIKAELHEGFSLHETKKKLEIEYLEDLLLTPQQKLYKIAFLIYHGALETETEMRTPADYSVYVYDHNMTRAETKQAALYFYEDFLGCVFSPSAKKLTSDFYSYTKDFINALKYDNEKKVDLHTSLYTYLKVSQSDVVDVAEYSNRYFPVKVRDSYLNFMEQKKYPSHAIPKDLTYLKHKLQKRNLKFSSDVKIIAPADKFSELVAIKGRDNGKTIVVIKGELEKED